MKVLKTLILIFLISLSSCETETLEINNETNSNITSETTMQQRGVDVFIRRGKIKKKRTSGYRVTLFTENASSEVASIKVLLEGSSGNTEFTTVPNGEANDNGITRYEWDLDGDGEFEYSGPQKLTTTLQNEFGEAIAEPQILWTTPQDIDGVDINNVIIKETNQYGIYKFKVNLGGNRANEITEVNLSIEGMDSGLIFPVDGSSLALHQDPENTKLWAVIAVAYEDANDETSLLISSGNMVSVTVTTINELGELIDNETHNIVVTEKPQEDGIVTQPVTLKLRNNGNGFIAKTKVKGKDKDKVEYVRIIFEEPYEGPAPLIDDTFDAEQISNNNIITNSYKTEAIFFNNPDEVIGSNYYLTIDYIDENGNSLFQTEQVVIAEDKQEDNDSGEYILTDLRIEQIEESSLFSVKAFIEGPSWESLDYTTFTLTPLGEGSQTNPEMLYLQFMEDAEGNVFFGSDELGFENYDLVDGQEYEVTFNAEENGGGTTITLTATITITYTEASGQ